jgi:hypothetical protein
MVLRETLTNSMQMMLVDKRTTAELTNREKESLTRLTRLIENAAQSIADLEQRKKCVIESQYKDPRTLQMPTYNAPPATHRRHHMVMNGSSIRDNQASSTPSLQQQTSIAHGKICVNMECRITSQKKTTLKPLQKLLKAKQLDNSTT